MAKRGLLRKSESFDVLTDLLRDDSDRLACALEFKVFF